MSSAALSTIIGRTPAGGRLYAAIVTAPPVPGSPLRRGVVAHSREVAALAPFADIDTAAAELKRLGCGPEPIGMEL